MKKAFPITASQHYSDMISRREKFINKYLTKKVK